MGRIENLIPKSLPPSGVVLGRYQDSSGEIQNLILLGEGVLDFQVPLDPMQLVEHTYELAKGFPRGGRKAVAIVGIGFGSPLGLEDFELGKDQAFESEHPREPDGTPEGGEFAPKGSNGGATDSVINQTVIFKDLSARMQKRVARAVLRNRMMAVLRGVLGVIADIVPIAGEMFDVYEITQIALDTAALEEEISATKAFVAEGAHDLEGLRAAAEDRSFSSADAFKKIEFGKYYGPAGDGYDYHHIVRQGGANADNIPPELLHSTENMIRMPRLIHEEITAAYRESSGVDGLSMNEWLDTQPYEVQYREGLRIMRNLGVIK